jgi:RNA polymerase sigma-70 factor (ECF subfamily)
MTLQRRFTACYEAKADAVFSFCLVRVSDREQALDLTQETFTRMWRAVAKGTEIRNDNAFLYTVARHLIIDWYRKKKTVSLEGIADPESAESYEPSDGKDNGDAEMGAESRYLLSKLREVSLRNRQAVYLRFVDGLSPPEIGKALGITSNTASVRVSRGLGELRHLAGYGPTEPTPKGSYPESP